MLCYGYLFLGGRAGLLFRGGVFDIDSKQGERGRLGTHFSGFRLYRINDSETTALQESPKPCLQGYNLSDN